MVPAPAEPIRDWAQAVAMAVSPIESAAAIAINAFSIHSPPHEQVKAEV
jgi:hypothetical protein